MKNKSKSNAPFDGMSEFAKEAIQMSKILGRDKVTPGVKTEIIWSPEEARSTKDIQEIIEFWLLAEEIDLQNTDEFRTDGTLSTFLYKGYIFNTLIVENPIFNYSKMILVSCYAFAPDEVSVELLEEFNLINHPGSFHWQESEKSPTGLFINYNNFVFGEPKSVQFALGTVLNLSVSLAEQFTEIWPDKFGGQAMELESLSELDL